MPSSISTSTPTSTSRALVNASSPIYSIGPGCALNASLNAVANEIRLRAIFSPKIGSNKRERQRERERERERERKT